MMFLVTGAIIGILFSYGIAGLSGYCSVTIECMPNGSYVIVDDNETTGLVMILVAFFTLALVPLLYCQLKQEYKRHTGEEGL